MTQHAVVKAKRLLRMVFFLFGWLMRKSSCDALDRERASLKQLLEAEAEG